MEAEPFRSIAQLQVRGGEPVFQPPPTVIGLRKLGTERCENTDREGDYLLKCQVIDLLGTMAEIVDGAIEEIEVRNGLPCTVKFVRPDLAKACRVTPLELIPACERPSAAEI
jgi:hypothetical protein